MVETYLEIREDVLEDLIIEAARAPPEPPELSFKPDLDMGEGKPRELELAYRRVLLLELERVYKEFDKILSSSGTVDDRIKRLDLLIQGFIKAGKILALKHVTDCFMDGVEATTDALIKLEILKERRVETDLADLEDLIKQQQDNVEDIGLRLRGRLRQRLRLDKAMDTYGKRNR